jgi:hypothetical protein
VFHWIPKKDIVQFGRTAMKKTLDPTEILAFKPRIDINFNTLNQDESDFDEKYNQALSTGRAILSHTLCPYCRSRLGKKQKEKAIVSNGCWNINIRHCDACGWWCTVEDYEVLEGGEAGYLVVNSILKKFKTSDLGVPVRELRNHLKKHPEALFNLHPRKFEELIAGVFSDFFKCEVELTAQTRDGGVDMYLVRAEDTYLVQAKRRSDPRAIEGVQVVRELAGVLLMSGYSKGIVVSTAQDFSKAAKKEVASPFLGHQGYFIELVNGRRFLETLSVARDRNSFEPMWHELLKTPFHFSSMKDSM